MSLLFSTEIKKAVGEELKSAQESVQIITAYCKESAISELDKLIDPKVKEKRIMLRFRLDDILKGSSDFSVIDFCRDNGWKVYIRFDLHAKTYIVDDKRGIVGSANATNSGLGFGRSGNYEMATLVDVEACDLPKINKMFHEALQVDDSLYNKLRKEFEMNKANVEGNAKSWSYEIINKFSPEIDTLFSYELPEVRYYADINSQMIIFLDLEASRDIKEIKEAFRWSNAYLWLLNTLEKNNGCLYFGNITEKLHNSLVSDPKPYRREVKELLVNLLSWVEELEMEEVMIDRPNYSQRVRMRLEG